MAATNCRFIPACAGNTCRGAAGTSSHPVHPRLRGEHAQCREVQQARGGSSPPARGTREQQTESRGIRRFIPACAGNTPSHFTLRTSPPVHPRLRGEHFGPWDGIDAFTGSSPPARGTPEVRAPAGVPVRFIPACAGNTLINPTFRPVTAVHPRLRGEHPDSEAAVIAKLRFIPACAGNTSG